MSIFQDETSFVSISECSLFELCNAFSKWFVSNICLFLFWNVSDGDKNIFCMLTVIILEKLWISKIMAKLNEIIDADQKLKIGLDVINTRLDDF